jgi:hypothetical protein
MDKEHQHHDSNGQEESAKRIQESKKLNENDAMTTRNRLGIE